MGADPHQGRVRHHQAPISLLALGEHGWIQVTNFVVCGLLFAAGAVGLRRTMNGGPGRTWGPVLVGVFAVALVWAGVFAADPVDGFPVGVPTPTEPTWHGIAHVIAPVAGTLALIAACVVFARRFAWQRRKGWMACSIASGAVLLVPDLFLGRDGFTLVLAVATAVGWCWVSAVALDHRRRRYDSQMRRVRE